MIPAAFNAVDREKVKKAAQLMKNAGSILFITGAGISADSGLPTYRGIGGLYNDIKTDEGVPIEMALGGEMFKSRPEVTWKYLAQIEQRCRQAQFNRGHEVIALAEKEFKRVWVLTQNIDGFHRAAGSCNIIDIHGNMYDICCVKCKWKKSVKTYQEISLPPKCPECGCIARPDVVLFGEILPVHKYDKLVEETSKGFDLYFSIGTTSVFPYISQPIIQAKYRHQPTVEINPSYTQVSDYIDIHLQMGAARALDAIWAAYKAG